MYDLYYVSIITLVIMCIYPADTSDDTSGDTSGDTSDTSGLTEFSDFA